MKIPVALLGATGTVGQKVIKLLENHPQFEIKELIASEKNVGQKYGDIISWREEGQCPDNVKNLIIKSPDAIQSPFAISSLPAEQAEIVEMELAERGIHVVSNASSYRMHKDVPLIVPEINATHLSLIERQGTKGKIITNPNCSTVFLALGLFPLLHLGTIEHVSCVTLQAVSGAGYPGVPSLDMIGNTIPWINGEEEKIQSEVKKILGDKDRPTTFSVTAHANRVPVPHGHSVDIHVYFQNKVSVEAVKDAFRKKMIQYPHLYVMHEEMSHPRPSDLNFADLRTHIGRIKQGDGENIVGLISMGHNLVRGAAGAAILNLELLHKYLNQ